MHRQLKKFTQDLEENGDDTGSAKLNIQDLLENANDQLEHLQKTVWINGTPVQQSKTFEDINREVFEVITRITPPEKHKEYCEKLIGFRVVYELHELHKSRQVKIIRYDPKCKSQIKLQAFGTLVSIKFFDSGTNIICLIGAGKFIQFKYNDALAVFQKLTDDEQLFLSMGEL
jgi:hypothetical protein